MAAKLLNTIKLNSEPTAEVTVTPIGVVGVVTVSDAITFTAGNWEDEQTITVTGIANEIDNGDKTIMIVHTVTGGDYGDVAAASVAVIVTDNDTAGVTVSDTALSVGENAGEVTYTIVLESQPTADVIVTPTVTGDDHAITVTPATLTFTADNPAAETHWNKQQTITVSGVNDDIVNEPNRMAIISHSVSGDAKYTALNDLAEVTVTVTDDETPMFVVPAAIRVAETDGVTASYEVALARQPSGVVRVAVAAAGDITVTPTTITFTTANWNEGQTITVTGDDDDINNVGDERQATIMHVASGGGYGGVAAEVMVTVTDDDASPSSPVGLSVASVSGVYDSLRVTWSPPADVNPVITGYLLQWRQSGDWQLGENLGVTDNHTITGLTAGGSYQVRLAAINAVDTGEFADAVGTVDINDAPVFDSVGLFSVAENSADGITVGEVTATDDENDALTFSIVGGDGESLFAINSVGGGAQISVDGELDYETKDSYELIIGVGDSRINDAVNNGNPDTEVDATTTITINITDVAEAPTLSVTGETTISEGETLSLMLIATDQDDGASFSYTKNNEVGELNANLFTWTPGFNSERQYEITFTVTDDDGLTDTASVTITVTDTPVTIMVTPATVSVAENNGTANYDVSVSAVADGGTITVAIVSSDDDAITVSHDELIFDNTESQTITVTGNNDDIDNDRTATITHTANGDGYSASATVTVTVTDDDVAGVTVMPEVLTIAEAGGQTEPISKTYSVVLQSQPSGDVIVTPQSSDTKKVTVSEAITFTMMNWKTSQEITVTGINDDIDNADNKRTATISHNVSGGGYDDVDANLITITVTDDDIAGFTVTQPPPEVDEGDSVTYTIKPNAEPTGLVTVTMTSADTTIATVTPTITFTAGDWDAKPITITGVHDFIDSAGRQVAIRHAIQTAAAEYAGVTIAEQTITVADVDVAGVTVTVDANFSVAENAGTKTYTVVLDSKPQGTVTVTPLSSDQSAATVSSVTFDASDWNVAKEITVTGVDDDVDNADNKRTVTISHGVSGDDNYDGELAVASVEVIVTDDDDVAGVTVTPEALTVTENGDAGTYEIVLDTKPEATVTVTPSGDDHTLTVTPATLTFTANDWATPQTITVTGVNDNKVNNPLRTATISHSVTNGDAKYIGSLEIDSVTVTVDRR